MRLLVERLAAWAYWHLIPLQMIRCDNPWMNKVYLWFASEALSAEERAQEQGNDTGSAG
jgi:hypothetical protein